MQLKTKEQYKKGMIVMYEKKKYLVQCSISCQWLYGTENYITVLKEIS